MTEWSDPWPVILGALFGIFTILVCIEALMSWGQYGAQSGVEDDDR